MSSSSLVPGGGDQFLHLLSRNAKRLQIGLARLRPGREKDADGRPVEFLWFAWRRLVVYTRITQYDGYLPFTMAGRPNFVSGIATFVSILFN